MKEKKKTTKKKKSYKELNKKEKKVYIIKYIILTIVLSLLVYFITTFVTTLIMKAITKPKETSGEHNILENLETSKSITVFKFIEKMNENLKANNLSYQVSGDYERKNTAYQYVIDKDREIELYLEPVQKLANQKTETLSMTALFVPQSHDGETVKKLLKVLILTHNDTFEENDIEKLIENLNDESKMTEADNIKTSEFYQLKGLEISKRIKDGIVSYRVGRIMK